MPTPRGQTGTLDPSAFARLALTLDAGRKPLVGQRGVS